MRCVYFDAGGPPRGVYNLRGSSRSSALEVPMGCRGCTGAEDRVMRLCVAIALGGSRCGRKCGARQSGISRQIPGRLASPVGSKEMIGTSCIGFSGPRLLF